MTVKYLERLKSGNAVVSAVARCGLTMRCTRHLTQPALRCRSRRSPSSAGELRRYVTILPSDADLDVDGPFAEV